MSITREKIEGLKALATHCPDATVVLSKDGFLDVCTTWLSMAERIERVEGACNELMVRTDFTFDEAFGVQKAVDSVRAALAGEG